VISVSGVSGVYAISGASVSGVIPDSSVPNPVLSGVSTSSTATGGVYVVNLTSSETLNGSTVFGGMLSNYGAQSEVTATLCPVAPGMNLSFELTGMPWYVIQLNAADTLHGIANWVTGASTIYVSGTTGSAYGFLRYLAPNKWIISGASVTTRNK
jgi:hypothetical protein